MYKAVQEVIQDLQCLTIDQPLPGKTCKKLPLGNVSEIVCLSVEFWLPTIQSFLKLQLFNVVLFNCVCTCATLKIMLI